MNKCKNCKYFSEESRWKIDEGEGECRLNSPIIHHNSPFPRIGEDDWCGKWERKIVNKK